MSKRKRGHWGTRGAKAGYRDRTNARMEARRLRIAELVPAETYLCRVCELWHVGTRDEPIGPPPRLHFLWWEIGERAAANMRAENFGGYRERMRALRQRGEAAERRRQRAA